MAWQPAIPRWGRPGAGLEAKFPDYCRRCNDDILVGERVVRAGSGYIHTRCASGADD